MASLRSYLTSTPSERDRFSNPVLLVWGYLVSLGDKLQSEMESLFSSSGSGSGSNSGGGGGGGSSSSSSSRGVSVSPNTSPSSFSSPPASSMSAWLGRTVFGSQDRHRQQQQQLQQRQHEDKVPCPSQQQQHYSAWGFSLTDLLRKLSPSSSPLTSSTRGTNRPQQQQQEQPETRARTVTAPSTPSTTADDSAAAGEASTSSVPTVCGCGAGAGGGGCCCQKLLPAVTGIRARATDKTLVLDLDETLIHARSDLREMGEGRFDFMVLLSDQRQRQRQKQQQQQQQRG